MTTDQALLGTNLLFRPYWRFEHWYDNTLDVAKGGNIPIPLIGRANPTIPVAGNPPGVDAYAYDDAVRAGDLLYAANLIAMTPMPALGSTALAYVPRIPPVFDRSSQFYYAFMPIWRMRTTADWRKFNKKYNMWRESPGAEDTRPDGPPGDRIIIPAASGKIIYISPEPTYDTGGSGDAPGQFAMQRLYSEALGTVSSPHAIGQAPYGPTGARLEHQQGIVNPAAGNQWYKPMFMPHWMKVCGNELGWLVYKLEVPAAGETELVFRDWDFDYDPASGYCGTTAEDLGFSIVFGVGADPKTDPRWVGMHPESGLWVFAGMAPL